MHLLQHAYQQLPTYTAKHLLSHRKRAGIRWDSIERSTDRICHSLRGPSPSTDWPCYVRTADFTGSQSRDYSGIRETITMNIWSQISALES